MPTTKTKRDHIVAVAGDMFVQHGYKAVSMDAIAEAAPVSKATLYNHFKDKKELFLAVITERCRNLTNILEQKIDTKQTPQKMLMVIGKQFMKLVLSPETINIHRIMIAEANEFPELGNLFYQSGPLRAHQLLANYLKTLTAANTLNVPDAELSASLFFSMLKGRTHTEFLLGVRKSITQLEQDKILKYVVNLFVKAHQVI